MAVGQGRGNRVGRAQVDWLTEEHSRANLLPAATQLKIKRLRYNPSTAGGLMNPDFASLPADATVAQALSAVRGSELEPGQLLTLWVIEADGHLASGVLASELLRSAEQTTVSELIENAVPAVSPETELPRGGGAGGARAGIDPARLDRPRTR
jgi:Mg/Co/Ni transporter MgtE